MTKYTTAEKIIMFILFPVLFILAVTTATLGLLWHCFVKVFNWVYNDKVLKD